LTREVYVVTHTYPFASNSLVVEMSNSDLVLVDTPWTPKATELLLDWIDHKFGKRKIVAINSHYHLDRLGGNSALQARKIPIYGSDHTAQLLDAHGEQIRKQALDWAPNPEMKSDYQTLQYVKPNHLFSEKQGLILTFGQEPVEISYPGPGHTPDNLVVYFPQKKLLFGGCFIIGMPKLGNLTEADPARWADSILNVAHYDAQWIIPGHGDTWSRSLLGHTARLLKEYNSNSK
jgi:metallo-beta-lactamase class B